MALKILAVAAIVASMGASAGFAQAAPAAAKAYQQAEARWRTPLCVGVTGLGEANAQYVADRVSQRAREVGLRVGQAGCRANALILFSADPGRQAAAIAAERTDPASRTGLEGATAGRGAFEAFVRSDQPVRWWRVSQPMLETGRAAVRDRRNNIVPNVRVPERGRLSSTTEPALSHAIIIVDLRAADGLSLGALADYLAMVTLAPVEQGEAGVGSVLSLFADKAAGRSQPTGLTGADRARLEAVYR